MNNSQIRKEYILTKNKLDNTVELCDLAYLEGIVEKLDTKLTRQESIEALNNIKKHIEVKRIYYDELEKKSEELKRKLWKGECPHEILYKSPDDYMCVFCGRWYFKKDINFNCFLIDLEKDKKEEFNSLANKIILEDGNVFEVLEDYIEEKEFENIKIYKKVGDNI